MYISKLKNSLNLEFLQNEFGEEEGYEKYCHRCWKQNRASKISSELFFELQKYIQHEILYEQIIHLNKNERELLNKKCIFVDAKIDNCILEFFGDIWHANESLFNEYDQPNPFSTETAKTIRENDTRRINILTQKGFHVKVIWENDFRNNKEYIIKECIEWIYIHIKK